MTLGVVEFPAAASWPESPDLPILFLLDASSGLERRMLEGHTPTGHTRYMLEEINERLGARRVEIVVPDDIGDLGFVVGSDLPDDYPLGSWVYITRRGGLGTQRQLPLRQAIVRVINPPGFEVSPASPRRSAA